MTFNKNITFTHEINQGKNVSFGTNVMCLGENITIGDNCKIESGCIIGSEVTIGRGAWAKPGSVILRSMPANAIIEGNPATVVGYRNTNLIGAQPAQLFDISYYKNLERPDVINLGVGSSTLHLLSSYQDVRGSLVVGEVQKDIPFIPQRYFVIHDVPSQELRGEHAHKRCHQFIVCIHGSCKILLDNGDQRCEVNLNSPQAGVYMPQMIWGSQYNYSKDAILLVFASEPYDEDDYIRTYDEYLQILSK